MARRVSIDIVGDPASFVRALRSSSNAASSFGRELKEVSVTAQKSAQAQVASAVKTDQRLRQELRAYREVAAGAKRGSREQVAAANLASRAESRLAHSVAVTARESSRHARIAGTSGREAGRTARGALAGSGAFRSLGRSLAFASSYFIGGYGLVYGLKASVQGASDLEEQVSKTNVVFGRSASGIVRWARTTATSFGISQRAALTYAGTFGALLRPVGFGTRQSAGMSRSLVERAADLASFYNTSEQDSLAAIQSGLVGQVRPLRRYGIQLSADRMKAVAFATGIAKPDVSARGVAEAEDRVAIAQVKVAEARRKHGANSVEAAQAALTLSKAEDQLHKSLSGSKAELTDQQKVLARIAIIMKDSALARGDFARTSGHLAQQEKILHAQLENEMTQIGVRLTPIVLHYVTSLNKWLGKSENQRRVTHAVTQAVHFLAEGTRIAARFIHGLAGAAKRVADAVGGWKHVFQIILAGVLISKLLRMGRAIHRIGVEAGFAAGTRGAGSIASAGGVWGLVAALAALQAFQIIKVGIEIYEDVKKGHGWGIAGDLAKLIPGAHIGIPGTRFQLNSVDVARAAWRKAFGGKSDFGGGGQFGGGTFPPPSGMGAAAIGAAAAAAGSQAEAEANAAAAARQRVAAKERRNRVAEMRQRMLEHQRELREAARRQAAQMRLLGFGPTGGALIPTKAALKRELGTVSQAIKGTFLDTGEHRSLLSKIRRLLSGQLGALSAEVRSKVKELLDDLKGAMNEFDGFNLTAADRHRRFLDRQKADRYGGKADHPTTRSGQVHHHTHHHFSPNVTAVQNEPVDRALRRSAFRMRTA